MGTNAEQFFEGVEKLLEIWFASSNPEKARSLRVIPRHELVNVLNAANCRICSVTSNDCMDSYVLSESSMFVSDERFVLKTCGSTSLLKTVEIILNLALRYCGLDLIKNVFYSRKNFQRPDLQPEVHKNFDREVAHLDSIFNSGSAYVLGPMNQERWYLYTFNPTSSCSIEFPDQTLEILMSDLDRDVMSIFTRETCCNGREATKLAGIDKLMPRGTIIDEKLFDPCGYSMNGILPNTDQYFTIHITPEPTFSYVSFETNVDQCCYFELLKKVLDCFKPGKFLMTVFANKTSIDRQGCQKEIWKCNLPGYQRQDCHFLQLPGDYLTYAHYKKTK